MVFEVAVAERPAPALEVRALRRFLARSSSRGWIRVNGPEPPLLGEIEELALHKHADSASTRTVQARGQYKHAVCAMEVVGE